MRKDELKNKNESKKATKNSDADKWRSQHGLSGQRHRAYSSLLRSYATVMRRVECLSQAEGALPPEWYDVLLALEKSPEGRLRIGELACHVTVSRSGVTRLVDKLEAEGLVARQMNPTDRRSFEILLTEKGREERARTWPHYARVIAEVFGVHYTDEEAAILADLLQRQFASDNGGTCNADSED